MTVSTWADATAAFSPQGKLNAWLRQRLALASTTPGKQDDIAFVSPDTGWYGNGSGKLYRTADGGETWAKVWEQPGTFIRALGFVDARHGFLGNVGTDYYPSVTDTRPLYRTRDGGVTWTKSAWGMMGITFMTKAPRDFTFSAMRGICSSFTPGMSTVFTLMVMPYSAARRSPSSWLAMRMAAASSPL